MKSTWIGMFVVLAFISACNENDEVAPRTNPRFSVTYVQEVDASGAEFMATMYDWGSDEILEHGFVFSKGNKPTIGTGEVLRAMGKPQSTFKLIGDHSMIKGETYNVAAFIKTSKTIVYSETRSFKSQGSEGFVFEKLEGGPEVYYGDTLTVFGKRFSNNLNNYEVKVNNTLATVVDLSERSFKIVVPDELSFGYPYDYDGKLVISIKVLDKVLEVESDIRFYEPIFNVSDREFTYEENFYIKGRYLRGHQISINYPNFSLEIVSNSDSMIVFKPRANFETLQPSFQVSLRGKIYEVDKSVRIQRTELEPNQKLKMGTIYTHVPIKGTNFNSFSPHNNFFVSDVDVQEQQFYIEGVTPTEARVSIYTNSVPSPRFLKVWAFNGGVKSTNYAIVENTEPTLPLMRAYDFPFEAAAEGRSVNWKDKGIWLLDGKITEVNPKTKTGRILKNVDIHRGNIASSFAVIHQDVVYFAGKGSTIDTKPGRFYSYNLNTGSLIELPGIPSKASTPRSIFVSGGYLYFGGGYYIDEIDVQKVAEGYKFHLATQTWSTWDKQFPILDWWDFENTFVHNGQVYGLVNEIDGSDFPRATRLMRFDNAREDWVELATYPYLGYVNGNTAMSIGEVTYVFTGGALVKINMETYARSVVPGVSVYDRGYTGPPFLFLSEGKIYYAGYNDYVIHEIDPFYFRD
jgi:hypothetical protein